MRHSNFNEKRFHELYEKIFYPELPYRSVKKDDDISKNVNSIICKECGGQCCRRCGCMFSPDDFEEISFEYLKKELEKGYISIEYIDREEINEDVGIFILRIRNKRRNIVDMNRRHNSCVLLSKHGCKLKYEQRPTGGKLLIPTTKVNNFYERLCYVGYKLKDCCYEWKPHQKVIVELIKYFEHKDIPCSL